jgi:GT2 family glycosyltransferase
VVVVSHHSHRWLEPCLKSALGEADEVVLVDNASVEKKVSAVGRALGVRVVRLERNVGFAAGVNIGLNESSGDVIGLLNDDAEAEHGWMAVASDVLRDPDIAAVAPKILFTAPHVEIRYGDEPFFDPPDPRPLGRRVYTATLEGEDVLPTLIGPGIYDIEFENVQGTMERWRWTSGREPFFVPIPLGRDPATLRLNGESVTAEPSATVINNAGSYLSTEGHGGDYGLGSRDDGRFDSPADRFAASGAAMAISREAADRVGHFAGEFFAYYEDLDWCWRAQLGGFRVRYDPRAVVRHVGGLTSGGPGAAHVRFLARRNRVLTLARNAPRGVLARQLQRAWTEGLDAAVTRSLMRRLPAAMGQRPLLARRWRRRPQDVWEEWAGVNETWSTR